MKNNFSTYHRLSVLDGLEMLHAKEHTINFPSHTHNTFNIALVLENTFNTKLENKLLKAQVDTLAITNPQEVHATPCDSYKGNSFFTFYISPEVMKTINRGTGVFFEDRTVNDLGLFNELFLLSKNFKTKQFDFANRLYQTLEKLVINYGSNNLFKQNVINTFRNFISEVDSFEKFSLEKTAKQFGLDKYKFLRLFKQETGLTPNNYLIHSKIEESKRQIKTRKPIFNIAIDLGFYDISHFYKNFKRFTGVTPKEYLQSTNKSYNIIQ